MKQRDPDPRFPTPTRPNRDKKAPANPFDPPEIDVGHGTVVLQDGRPAVFENWYETECELFCRTFYYSTLETEDWDGERHFQYLSESGFISDRTYPGTSAGIQQKTDENGETWWTVTITICEDPD